jgi:hypothetical protein
LFINNGPFFVAVCRNSNASDNVTARNCRSDLNGFQNFFILLAKAGANSTASLLYSDVYNSSGVTPYAFAYTDGSSSAYYTNAIIVGNYLEGKIGLYYDNNQKANTAYITNNKLVQGLTPNPLGESIGWTAYASLVHLHGEPSGATYIYINGNIFLSRIPNSSSAITASAILDDMDGTHGRDNVTILNNIFYGNISGNFNHALTLAANISNPMIPTPPVCNYNIFYGIGGRTPASDSVFSWYWALNQTQFLYSMFVNNYRLLNGGSLVTWDYNIAYNTTAANNYTGGGSPIPSVYGANQVNADPLFNDPDNLDFSYPPTSPVETFGFWELIAYPFLIPVNVVLNLKYLNIVGAPGKSGLVASANALVANYCNIENFFAGVQTIGGTADVYYSTFYNNGFADKQACAGVITSSDIQYNIFQDNNIAVALRSAAEVRHNTIINNGYGLTEFFTGIFAQSNYMSQYVIVKDNIIVDNLSSDYYGKLPTDYNVIFKRYFDGLAPTDPNYTLTAGPNDVNSSTILDPGSLYPATKITGYIDTSAAYLTASDGVYNRGARYMDSIISSTLNKLSYKMYAVGTLDDEGRFYALENPQTMKNNDIAMNPNAIRTTRGDMLQNPTGYASEITLAWGSPGVEGKISDAGRIALRLTYMTYWIIGISFDNGQNFTYYRVDKTSPLNMELQKYTFSGLPMGNASLHFIEIPDFDITEFTI